MGADNGFTISKNQKYLPAGTTSYNITCEDDYIMVNTSTSAVALYLPNIKGSGLDFAPKKFYINDNSGNAGTNNITIYGIGGNLVNSGASVTLNTNGVSAEVLIVSPTEYLVNRDSAYAGAVWGSITGNILNQLDLQAEFATKQDLLYYYKESLDAPVQVPTNLGSKSVIIGDASDNDAPSEGIYSFGSSNSIATSINVMIAGLNNSVTTGNEIGIYSVSSFYSSISNGAFVGRGQIYSNVTNVYAFGETLLNSSYNNNMLIGFNMSASYANAVEIGIDGNHKIVIRDNGSVLVGTNNDMVMAISGGYSVAGTAGAGYGQYVAQSSAPSAGTANTFRMYAGSTGALSWRRNDNASDTFTRTLDGTLTANRVYTLPDASGTLALTSALTGYFSNGGNAFGANAILGLTDNYDLSIYTNNTLNSKFTKTGTFEFNGGAGIGSDFSIHQTAASAASTGRILDIYNASFSKQMLLIADASGAGTVSLGAGGFVVDAYTSNSAFGGVSPNSARVRIFQDSTNDIVSINPSTGSGGIYANSSSGHPYFYFQNSSALTTVELRANGVSYFNGGGLNLGATGGSGYLGIVAQSSAPSNPSAAGFRHYAGSTGAFSWVRNDGVSDTFTRTLDGTLTANRTYTLPDASGTLSFGTGSNTQIAFWSGANTLTGASTFLWNGTSILVGTASQIVATNVADFFRNQNAATSVWISNNTSNTAAQTMLAVTSDNGTTNTSIRSYSAGFTTSGIQVASTGVVLTTATAGMNVGTVSNTQLSFWANNTKHVSLDAAGPLTHVTNGTNGINLQSLIGTTTSSAIYLNQSSPSATNYALASSAAGSTLLSGAGNVIIQHNAANRLIFNSGGYNMSPGQGIAGTSIIQTTFSNNSSQTASTNVPKWIITLGTTQWLTGTLAQGDFIQYTQPSVLFSGASTATLANTLTINGAPIASTNATITTSVAFYIGAGSSLTASVTTGYAAYFNAPTGAGTNYALGLAGSLNIIDANNVVVGTTTGTKFGTATTQKIGFFNATPIVQPANTVAIDTVLVNLGLRASGANANFDTAIINSLPIRLKNYTVATLPAGTQGDVAYVTDALAPAFLTTVVGGGAVKAPVFYDGTNWVAF